jgi:hypothetical protein
VIRRILAAALGIAFVLGAELALGQVPPVIHPRECSIVADMLLTARSLVKNGVSKDLSARLLADIYAKTLESGGGGRAAIYLDEALHYAGKTEKGPVELADDVERSCIENGGELNYFFGDKPS